MGIDVGSGDGGGAAGRGGGRDNRGPVWARESRPLLPPLPHTLRRPCLRWLVEVLLKETQKENKISTSNNNNNNNNNK